MIRFTAVRSRSVAAVVFAAVGVLCAHADDFDFFERHVRPVLIEHCYECHSEQSSSIKAGLRVDLRDGLLKGGESGKPAIVPGNADQSRLIEAIRYGNPDLQMPPKKKLDDEAVKALEAWVMSGAPDPRTEAAGAIAPPKRPLWAIQPISDPAVPAVHDAAFVKNPIDAFIAQKLEATGLRPAAPADKRTLIRRATYDLTGLPPTAEEVDAFLADATPNAFETIIDRLLASPHYGERWGRHWLDVARYADTKGYVYSDREDARFIHSYVYRDWVVNALNQDMPYDRFLLLQIAADQVVTDDNKTDLAAMGFLTLGRRFLGVMHDIIDDRIDTMMRGTQALTVACARCHDHKFDPIPTEDYYSLYGIFAGSTEQTIALAGEGTGNDEVRKAYEDKHAAAVAEYQKRFDAAAAELSTRLRSQTKEYLVAVLDADKLPTEDFYEIRQANELNPTVVRKWQAYLLKRSADDPVFGPWRAFEAMPADSFAAAAEQFIKESMPKDKPESDTTPQFNGTIARAFRDKQPAGMKDVAERYGDEFLRVREAWRDLLEQTAAKGEPAPAGLPDADDEALRAVLFADDSPVTVPKGSIVDQEWYFDEPTRVELGRLQRLIDASIIESEASPPHAVILQDRADQKNARVFKRGNPAMKGDEVPRQYLAALASDERKPFETGSGRLELAKLIANDKNPLTARVMVNRIWLHHFGRGLVSTPSDFGARSEPPSHPELLDWLATQFVRNGWSLKKLHRLIMTSNTYGQSSDLDEASVAAATQVDPENRLLWRFERQRLDFESMRDATLAVSGSLDRTMGGRAASIATAPFNTRRTIYGYVDRQFLAPMFKTFDYPNPDMHSPQRFDTTVPQQALFLMNSPFLMEQARALASRTAGAEDTRADERIRAMYRSVLQRDATDDEVYKGLVFLASVPPPPTVEAKKPVSAEWKYGYGEFDAATQRIATFEPLPHFTGEAWQGGDTYPDDKLGWLRLTADAGHPGNDMQHAVVRRWVSPIAGAVTISGDLVHALPAGNGIAARIVSSRAGVLGEWQLHNATQSIAIPDVAVEPGDTIDFVVDIAGELNSDDFKWAPKLVRATPAPAEQGADYATEWDAMKDFGGPSAPAPVPMQPWDQYAQVLLLTNEFAYVD